VEPFAIAKIKKICIIFDGVVFINSLKLPLLRKWKHQIVLKNQIRLFIVALLLVLSRGPCWAQATAPLQVVAPCGGESQNGGFVMTWTIGEPVTNILVSDSTYMVIGFHQPRNLVVSVVEISQKDVKVVVYPNPTASSATLEVAEYQFPLYYKVVTMDGKIVHDTQSIAQQKTTIDMQGVAVGIYFLVLTDSKGGLITTFKLQKIQ